MIYTSYFAKLKSLPDNIVPISICGKAPDWYTGLQYKKLAPRYDFFMEWKKNHDNEYYIKCFNEQVLSKLNATDVILDLSRICYGFNVGECDICLICYEKPTDFCHRHLVADWLNQNGYKCDEYLFSR
ncbi:hypothetical protein DW172_03195 [Agathobacter rectalis]|uniref:DUF488 domain-containing protein n=1 Tax=Agathobacter rectalis TaxID=39491 RepID=A0A414ZR08_9FIRM|nr:hypothetical protein [Agathobacter rectalis]RHI25702.1 hypothetical protein DW172_03195 [Agathobacter rectalis]